MIALIFNEHKSDANLQLATFDNLDLKSSLKLYQTNILKSELIHVSIFDRKSSLYCISISKSASDIDMAIFEYLNSKLTIRHQITQAHRSPAWFTAAMTHAHHGTHHVSVFGGRIKLVFWCLDDRREAIAVVVSRCVNIDV